MALKILFLVPYPLKQAPSQRFRFEQYFSILRQTDCTISVKSFLTEKGWKVYYSRKLVLILAHLFFGFLRRFFHSISAFNYDYIFIHRELTPIGPPLFEWFIAKVLKKKIIYDFDDAIWIEDPDEKGTLLAKLKWKSKVSTICRWSYKISAGNEFLANYAANYNKNVFINPTTIDTDNLHNPLLHKINERTNELLCFGWTGTHSTLQYLEPLIPILRRLEKDYEFIFKVIANKRPEFELKSLQFIPWKKKSEIEDLMVFDIGLMPLTSDPWSKGKCGFKALQYLSLEKPAVVSPIGVNEKIVENLVTGYHCNTTKDWHECLENLIRNRKEIDKMGKLGRAFVENNYSVNSNKSDFLALFDIPY
ncbi:MAG: glycosyltransferase family 1 protein [Bacteroidota bacterium]